MCASHMEDKLMSASALTRVGIAMLKHDSLPTTDQTAFAESKRLLLCRDQLQEVMVAV